MDYQSRYPNRSNSDPTTAVYIETPEYQSNFKAHWPNNMYSQQQLQAKKQLLGGSFDENKQNRYFGKIYSTKQSLSVDSMPKRDSLWQSLTRSATNLLGKHLNNTGSILKNWSSMNTPLSVTVVSPDLYKSLQASKDHQMMTPAKGFFATSAWIKETNQPSDDMLYNAEIMSDTQKKDTDPSDSEKRWNEYKCMYINCIDLNTKDQDVVDSVNNSQQAQEQLSEEHFDFAKLEKDTSANFGNIVKVDDEPVILEKPESPMAQMQEQSEVRERVKMYLNSSEDEDEVDEGDDKNSVISSFSSCSSEDSYCIIFDEDAADDLSSESESDSESESAMAGVKLKKKVRFNLVPKVHPMIAWQFAYKAARQNHFLNNRDHFRARICRLARILEPVLRREFRDRIYHERFEE